MTDRRTTEAGANVDETTTPDRRTTEVGANVDFTVGGTARRITSVGVMADGFFPPTHRNTTSAGALVDEKSTQQRRTTSAGALVDERATQQRRTSTIGALVDERANQQRRTSTVGVMVDYSTVPVNPFVPPPIVPVTRAWVVLYDTSGHQIALFDDWKTVEVKTESNNYSTHTFAIDGADPRVRLFGVDSIVQIWRQVGVDCRYVEYEGFHRTGTIQLTADQHSIFVSQGRSFLDLIHRRFVNYPEGTYFTLKSGPGESVIKAIVNENVGPAANSALRYYNGLTKGFLVEADFGQGFTWTDTVSNENVLDVIRKIAALTQVDFEVTTDLCDGVGPEGIVFTFVVRAPQLGTDRSAYLTFAPEFGNMVAPTHTQDWSNEVNVVTVLGPGQGGARLVQTFLGDDIDASPWNICEGTASPHTLPGALGAFLYQAMQYAGQQKLTGSKASIKFDFDPLQTDVVAYGRDYGVGDLITGQIQGHAHTLKIVGSTLTIREGKETIKLVIENLVTPVVPAPLPIPPPPPVTG